MSANPVFATATELAASTTIDISQDVLETNGKLAVADLGQAKYQQVATNPNEPGSFVLQNGRYAKILERHITPQMFRAASDDGDDALMLARFFDYAVNKGGEAVIPFLGTAGYTLRTTVPIVSPIYWRSKVRCDGAVFKTAGAIFAFTVTSGGYAGGIALEDFTISQQANPDALGGFNLLGTGGCKLIRPVISGGGTRPEYSGICLGVSNPTDPGTGSLWTEIINPQIFSYSNDVVPFGILLEGSANETTIYGGLLQVCLRGVSIYPGQHPYYSANNVRIENVGFELGSYGVYFSGVAGEPSAAVGSLKVLNNRFENFSAAAITILNGETGVTDGLHEHGNYLGVSTSTLLYNPHNCPIHSTSLPQLLSGQTAFAASASASVTFARSQPGSNYVVTLDVPDNKTYWVDNKTASGFTIHASSSTSATVGWKVTRLY